MKSRTVWPFFVDRDMAPHGFLLAVIHLSVYVYGYVSVEQWPPTVQHTTGENTTLFCKIHADGKETISKCHMDWYRQEGGQLPEVKLLSQFKGRFQEHMNYSQWSGSLSLTALELNDTGKFYCNYFCLIDGSLFQHNGSGTHLSVHEEDAVISTTTIHSDELAEEMTTDNVLFTVLLFLPLYLKLVVTVFLCIYTLISFYVRCYCLFSFTHLRRF
ncbi:uncharacterized protein [Salminus brasiliensis]|uniref:uncharacterized protein n=1 Tax=Salminus brasiliensis TaxID=930266 RepID=UPI003B82FC02